MKEAIDTKETREEKETVIINSNKVKSNPFAKKNKKVLKFDDIKLESEPEKPVVEKSQPELHGLNDHFSKTPVEPHQTAECSNLSKYANATAISSDMLHEKKGDEQTSQRLSGMGNFKAIGSDMLHED